MAFLDIGPQLREYTARAMFNIFNKIEVAVNNIDRTNFRRPISGDHILRTQSVSMDKLAWREMVIPLVMPATAFQTTSVTPINIGGVFVWSPTNFPGGQWFLEADISIANAASVATCEIMSAAVLQSVTTQATQVTTVRSLAIPMPLISTNLWARVRTSNASHAATVAGVKLIFVP